MINIVFESIEKLEESLDKNINRYRNSYHDDNYGIIELTKERRCSFLDVDNLCDIYKELGEGTLCNTCKMYPRFINKIGNRYERSMTISCPEVARLILMSQELIGFELVDGEIEEFEKPYVRRLSTCVELEDFITEVRNQLIDIAQNRNIPIWKRIIFIKQFSDRIQENIENKIYSNDILFALQQYVSNEENISLLDNIEVPKEGKEEIICSIFEVKKAMQDGNEVLISFIGDVEEFNKLKKEDKKRIEDEFEEYMLEREYILENYIVYYLYKNYIQVLEDKNSSKQITMMVINYVLIKHMLMIRWHNKNANLSIEDMVQVIYAISRGTEHNVEFVEQIYISLKENEADSLLSIIMLVR